MKKDKKNSVQRNYKDTLFRMVFSDKEALLSLYNAVSGKDYKDPDELEIVTLENAIYMNRKNDLAFIIDFSLNLYEHQSTDSPNLPMRNLFYISRERMKKCKLLFEYMQYVEKVRQYTTFMHISQAVERAVNECIKEGILGDFLLKNKAEAVQMSIFEYDEEKEMKLFLENEREIGLQRGIRKGRRVGIREGRREGREEATRENIKSFILFNLEEQIKAENIVTQLERIFGVLPDEGRRLISLYRKAE